jgi:prophage antirepressor-like protein
MLISNDPQENIMNTQLNPLANPFQFEALDVRTATDENGEVWFCAKDVCAVLNITWSGATLENMEESWVIMLPVNTIKGERDTNFINISGFYYLIFRSDKPEARKLANWVYETVLPSIRKHGFYGKVSTKEYLSLVKEISLLTRTIMTSKNVFEIETLLPHLRNLHNMAGTKMPPLERIKADIEQTDLFLAGAK